MRGIHVGMAIALTLAIVGVVHGQQSDHRCAVVVDPAQRLACYDKAYPPPLSVHEAARAKARDEFGRDAVPVAAMAAEDAKVPERIRANVAHVDYGAGGSRDVALDNGQVWRVVDAASRGVLAEGDAIQVRKAALGSFMLVTRAGVPLRVRRVR